jgi:hypothetical protein
VKLLERALDVAHPERTVEAEIWEAIGRAYAGPLEDIERAQRCYRRALECNPLRSSAARGARRHHRIRPAAHRESRTSSCWNAIRRAAARGARSSASPRTGAATRSARPAQR